MKISHKLSVIIFACALAACSTVTVTTDYDHTTSFAKYKTYRLEPAKRGQTLSPTSEAALANSLRQELGARGITEAPNGAKADLAVVRTVFVQQNVSVQQYTDWGYGYHNMWPYGYGYYGMWNGAPMTYTTVNQYHEGTLIIDFVDTRTKKLVFRGTGSAVVGGPNANAGKIEEAVRKMVNQMPH